MSGYDPSHSAETALSKSTSPSSKLLKFFNGGFKDITPKLQPRVLDFGAGKGRHLDALRRIGYSVYGYDPYNGYAGVNPMEGVTSITPNVSDRFDIVFTAFVLNVLNYEEMISVVRSAEYFTKEGGYTVHIVREDLRKLRGDSMITRKGTYQRDIPISQLTDLGYTRIKGLFVKEKEG